MRCAHGATLRERRGRIDGPREFIELLLAQPVGASGALRGTYGGHCLAALAVGVGLPFLWHGGGEERLVGPLVMLITCGVRLTLAFTAVAFLVSLVFEDRPGAGSGNSALAGVGGFVRRIPRFRDNGLLGLSTREAADRADAPQPSGSRTSDAAPPVRYRG